MYVDDNFLENDNNGSKCMLYVMIKVIKEWNGGGVEIMVIVSWMHEEEMFRGALIFLLFLWRCGYDVVAG